MCKSLLNLHYFLIEHVHNHCWSAKREREVGEIDNDMHHLADYINFLTSQT